MSRRLRSMVAISLAFIVLSAGDCDLGDILNKPGKIEVTNTGTETAVIAIIADDVTSYPTLAAGRTASVSTNVGGQYQVQVVMTPQNALDYREDLNHLKDTVKKLIDGSVTAEEKTYLFTSLAGINAAITALQDESGAGCIGQIKLDRDKSETVDVSVRFRSQSGSGFWDMSCGSN